MPRYILRPNADVKADWTEDAVGTAWSKLDEAIEYPTAPTTGSDRITTTANNQTSSQGVETFTKASDEVVVATRLWVYGKAVNGSNSFTTTLYTTPGAVLAATAYTSSSFGWSSATYEGDLTQAQIDALEARVISSGASGTREVNAAYIEVITHKLTGRSLALYEAIQDLGPALLWVPESSGTVVPDHSGNFRHGDLRGNAAGTAAALLPGGQASIEQTQASISGIVAREYKPFTSGAARSFLAVVRSDQEEQYGAPTMFAGRGTVGSSYPHPTWEMIDDGILRFYAKLSTFPAGWQDSYIPSLLGEVRLLDFEFDDATGNSSISVDGRLYKEHPAPGYGPGDTERGPYTGADVHYESVHDPDVLQFGYRGVGAVEETWEGGIEFVAVIERSLLPSERRALADAAGLLVTTGERVVSEKAPPIEIVATAPDGVRHRWAYDERNPANVPDDLAFSSSMPGGADTISATLRRRTDEDYPDLARFTDLRVGRSGGRTMDFRVEKIPRSSGGFEESVTVEGSGYRSALEDRQDARAIFVNRALSDWQLTMPYQRAALLYALGLRRYDPAQVEWDSTGQAIELGLRGPFNTTTQARRSEAFFDGQGIPIADMYFDLDPMTTPGTATMSVVACLVRDATYYNASGSATSANLAAGTAAGYLSAIASPFTLDGTERAASFQVTGTGAGTAEKDHVVRAGSVAVYGAHGLTKYGPAPGGFYTGQMVEWLVDNLTELTAGTIDLGTFLHPHASYMDPATPLAILEDLVRYEPLFDWYSFTDRRVEFRRRGTFGRRWRARVGEADLQTSGESIERLYNEVAVKVADPALGDGLIVGPPGSGYANTSDRLVDSDPTNPATAAAVPRRALLDIGEGTLAGAIEVGARFLEETRALDTSGEARLVGLVSDDAGIPWPVDEVRAGDEIAFSDAADTSYRRIVATNYTAADLTNSISLDAPPETMEALLARLGATLVPLG